MDWKLFAGGSMICVVELKYRAPLGRRNIGGSADAGNRMSNTDFLMVLLNILFTLNYRGAQLLLLDALKFLSCVEVMVCHGEKNIAAWLESGIIAARDLGVRKLLNISRSILSSQPTSRFFDLSSLRPDAQASYILQYASE